MYFMFCFQIKRIIYSSDHSFIFIHLFVQGEYIAYRKTVLQCGLCKLEKSIGSVQKTTRCYDLRSRKKVWQRWGEPGQRMFPQKIVKVKEKGSNHDGSREEANSFNSM